MKNQNWNNSKTQELFKAFLTLGNVDEVAAFCRDLMTEAEIEEFAARFQVAKRLNTGESQRQVSKITGVSIATVTRVNQWLKRGMGGYLNVLASTSNKNHSHHSTLPLASPG